jgi:DNA-binding response OmpR family regulator
LKRSQDRRAQGVLQVGELRIDPVAREVSLGHRAISLSAKEFALLRMLAGEPTRVFTKEELLRDVWASSWWVPGAVAQIAGLRTPLRARRRFRAGMARDLLSRCHRLVDACQH